MLAAEDRDFYTESAIDPKAMLRAGWNTATGKGKQSGSTITQQYVKNYYLGQEQTVTRKVKEFFISIKLDREKSQGRHPRGLPQHQLLRPQRLRHPGRRPGLLRQGRRATSTTAQGAYLAALLNAPSEYDVVAHPENKRRGRGPLELRPGRHGQEGLAHRGRAGRPEVPRRPKRARPPTGLSGQRGYLVEAVKDYLTEQRHHRRTTPSTRAATASPPPSQKRKQNAFVEAVDDQVMAKLDKTTARSTSYVRAGGASIDPKTGKVVAMYGGIDYTKQYVNNATRRDYQVGSTFKPFVFTSAVAERLQHPGRPAHHPEHRLRRHQQAPRSQRRTAAPATPRRTRTTSLRRHHRPRRPPTSPSTPSTRRWPSTSAPRRSRRPRSTSACPPTPPT